MYTKHYTPNTKSNAPQTPNTTHQTPYSKHHPMEALKILFTLAMIAIILVGLRAALHGLKLYRQIK